MGTNRALWKNTKKESLPNLWMSCFSLLQITKKIWVTTCGTWPSLTTFYLSKSSTWVRFIQFLFIAVFWFVLDDRNNSCSQPQRAHNKLHLRIFLITYPLVNLIFKTSIINFSKHWTHTRPWKQQWPTNGIIGKQKQLNKHLLLHHKDLKPFRRWMPCRWHWSK